MNFGTEVELTVCNLQQVEDFSLGLNAQSSILVLLHHRMALSLIYPNSLLGIDLSQHPLRNFQFQDMEKRLQKLQFSIEFQHFIQVFHCFIHRTFVWTCEHDVMLRNERLLHGTTEIRCERHRCHSVYPKHQVLRCWQILHRSESWYSQCLHIGGVVHL